jgi:hypothetical protein
MAYKDTLVRFKWITIVVISSSIKSMAILGVTSTNIAANKNLHLSLNPFPTRENKMP